MQLYCILLLLLHCLIFKVHSLLKKASENRAVAETKCNERSSRSHSVFRLKITGLNEITKEGCEGGLFKYSGLDANSEPLDPGQ